MATGCSRFFALLVLALSVSHCARSVALPSEGASPDSPSELAPDAAGELGTLTVLENGVPSRTLAGAQGSSAVFQINVPAGATHLLFSLQTGSGAGKSADLLVKFSTVPTPTTYDCRSWKTAPTKDCSFPAPAAGAYDATVYGFQAFSGVVLTASYVTSGAGDHTAPTITLAPPAAAGSVQGALTLAATASDDVGVSQVQFFVDGQVVGAAAQPPYVATWDTRSVPNGAHVIVAKAIDAAGNVGVSNPASVTVANLQTSDGGAQGTDGGTDGGSHPGSFRVLFDTAHNNVAGNADWLVDSHGVDPVPSNPTSESQWSGGISAWAFGLHASGRYVIKQLPTQTSLNFGAGGPGDLQNFEVFISDEPELAFNEAEQSALMQFAQKGGGIFLVSDHSGAVRCSSCTQAWQVINGFLQTGAANAFGVKCDGNSIGSSGLIGSATSAGLSAPFTQGPFGHATGLSYHAGTSVSLSGAGNPNAAIVVSSSSGGMMAASTLPSGGRLVLLGDSSPTDDGTCTSCGAKLHGGWAEASDSQFILNATAWLAHDGI